MDSEATFSRRYFMKGAGATLAVALTPDHLQGQNPGDSGIDVKSVVLSHEQAENLTLHKMDKHIINDAAVVGKLMELGIVSKDSPKFDLFIFRRSLAGIPMIKAGFCKNVVKEFNDDGTWNAAHKGEAMTVENVERRFWERVSAHITEEVIKIRTKDKRGIKLSMTEEGEKKKFAILFGPLDQVPLAPFDMDALNVKDDKWVEAIARNSPKVDLLPAFAKLGISPDILHITAQDLRETGIRLDGRQNATSDKNWAERSARAGSAGYIKK